MSSWDRDGQRWLRPQSVAFTLLAEHVMPHGDVALFSGSFIDALARVGITEHATRATLSRMVQRGLLVRHRRGRRVYFGMTQRCRDVLEEGRERIWELGAVNTDDDADWTILTFSLPEAWQRERHDLRSRLTWAGFGSLHSGVWIAPSVPDTVESLVEELGLDAHVHLFQVQPSTLTDLSSVAGEAFDLDTLAAGYEQFLEDWRDCPVGVPAEDPLALTLRLSTEWLQVLRHDPRVPVSLLDEDWPAVAAQERFRTLHADNAAAATEVARRTFETISPGTSDA